MKKIITIVLFLFASKLWSVDFYNIFPDWQSTEPSQYSTGCAWVDINGDGLNDLLIADGNDIQRQTLKVYYNTGNGIENTASWQSSDLDYHGHLAVGDITGNGYPDVVVSVYIGETGFNQPGYIKMYENIGGELSAYPVWFSDINFYTFSCILVDLNLDGYLDLAVATGEAYHSINTSNYVFYNQGGILETTPSWQSDEVNASYDVTYADFDKNGYPDLIFVSACSPNLIYFNYESGLATTAGWVASDDNKSANSVTVADFNNNGWMDIAVSDNKQLHSPASLAATFKIYFNNNGEIETLPSWMSNGHYYGSGIEAIDLNNDGFPDIIAGGWWESLKIFMNDSGQLSIDYDWTSSTGSVVEAIVFADIRQNSLIDTFVVVENQAGRYFDIFDSNVFSIISVELNQILLSDSLYYWQQKPANLYLKQNITSEDFLVVNYKKMIKPDMIVSNWGSYKNYIFYYQDETDIIDESIPYATDRFKFEVYPNPLNINLQEMNIKASQDLKNPELSLYNIKGQLIYKDKYSMDGKNQRELKLYSSLINDLNLVSGMYFLTLKDNDRSYTKRVLMLK